VADKLQVTDLIIKIGTIFDSAVKRVPNFLWSDVFWFAFYVLLMAALVLRSSLWLFFSELGGGLTRSVIFDLWANGASLGVIFSIWLWVAIVRNTFGTTILRFMILVMMLGLLCNWVLLYAIAYSYLGIIDNEKEVREPITCLYFSIVTWTTLGYGDIRPSLEARVVAASEALLGYIWMGLFIGTLATLFKQPSKITNEGA
jgi:ion channel